MNDQNRQSTAGTHPDRTARAVVKRLACGTVLAAGAVGALAMSTGPAVHTAPSVANIAIVQPMQPPVPPGPPVPPPMQEPGQEGPGSSIHDQPPGPAPAEPNENAICQDIMDIPDSGKMINPDCTDPADWA